MPSRQNSNNNDKNIFGASKKNNLVIMPFHAIEENQQNQYTFLPTLLGENYTGLQRGTQYGY